MQSISRSTVNRTQGRQKALSRREFLGRAAAVAAISVVPRNVLGGPGHVPPSEKTTVAGIGVGGQGMQDMANLLQLPEIQAVAVCDVNRESGGYLSMNWALGKDRRLGGREPAQRTVDEYYAQEKRFGDISRLQGVQRFPRAIGQGEGGRRDGGHSGPCARRGDDGRDQGG